jgi:hypothetical protein
MMNRSYNENTPLLACLRPPEPPGDPQESSSEKEEGRSIYRNEFQRGSFRGNQIVG